MNKTERMSLKDLIEELKQQIWAEEIGWMNPYSRDSEEVFLKGINEGIDRAYRVLADFNLDGFILREKLK